jgi:uncharacterized RDD family membrane protein YckC
LIASAFLYTRSDRRRAELRAAARRLIAGGTLVVITWLAVLAATHRLDSGLLRSTDPAAATPPAIALALIVCGTTAWHHNRSRT